METERQTNLLVVIKTEETDSDTAHADCQGTKTAHEPQNDEEISSNLESIQGVSSSCDHCIESQLSQLSTQFVCGSCRAQYDTICNLHAHIQAHGLGGSYHYDHRSRTAFPKYDSVCQGSQIGAEMSSHVTQLINRNKPDQPKLTLNENNLSKSTRSENQPAQTNIEKEKADLTVCSAAVSLEGKDTSFEKVSKNPQPDSSVERHSNVARVVNMKSKCDENPKDTEKQSLKRACKLLSPQGDKSSRLQKKNRLDTSRVDSNTCSVFKVKAKVVKESRPKIIRIIRKSHDTKVDDDIQSNACVKCKLVFSSEEFLQAHMQKHEGKMVCDCCDESFQSLEDLQVHLLDGEGRDIKAVDMFVCSLCGIVITELKGLKAHLCPSEEDLSLQRQTVRTYNRTVTTKKEVYGSIPLTKGGDSTMEAQCETCQVSFENDYFLILHSVVHRYPYKCGKCSLHFMSDVDRDQHCVNCINPASRWKCSICGRRFNSQTNLRVHKETHKDTKDLQCDMCGKSFKTKRSLTSHVKRCPALANRERKFSCEVCGKKFYEKYRIREHMETAHSEDRRFVCEVCGASFKMKMLLNRHLMIHQEDRPAIVCDFCGASFKDRICLNRHRKRHVELCKEQCTYCGKMFYERWNLKAHMRQHTGEKPYKCDKCGKGFTHNVSKKAHMSKCCK